MQVIQDSVARVGQNKCELISVCARYNLLTDFSTGRPLCGAHSFAITTHFASLRFDLMTGPYLISLV